MRDRGPDASDEAGSRPPGSEPDAHGTNAAPADDTAATSSIALGRVRRPRALPWWRSLRVRLALGYAIALVVATLGLAIWRDFTYARQLDGGVLRLHGELHYERAGERLPWYGSQGELDAWVAAMFREAWSASFRRRLAQIAVIDGHGVVLAAAGPGRAAVGRPLAQSAGEGTAELLRVALDFQNRASVRPAARSVDVRLKDAGGQLANGHDLAIVAFQDASGYVFGGVVRELEPTAFGNLKPLFYGVVRNTPAPLVSGLLFIAIVFHILLRRLDDLSAAAREWSRGQLSRRAAPGAADELGGLTVDLNAMAERLAELLRTREDRAAAEERNRLARDLHDAVKQQLFAAKLHLAAARRRNAASDAAASELADAERLVEAALQELAALVRRLRPPTSRELGASLEAETRIWSRGAGIPIRTEIDETLLAPAWATEALTRVLQEALANAARHSDAGAVSVTLAGRRDELVMAVADDGNGFDLATPAAVRGLGLANMRDRMREVGGRLQVDSAAGRGTVVTAVLPTRRAGAASAVS